MITFFWVCLIGLCAGAAAKAVMGHVAPDGCFLTMLLGVVGALLGEFVGRQVGLYEEGDLTGFFSALTGAVLVLGAYRAMVGNRESR